MEHGEEVGEAGGERKVRQSADLRWYRTCTLHLLIATHVSLSAISSTSSPVLKYNTNCSMLSMYITMKFFLRTRRQWWWKEREVEGATPTSWWHRRRTIPGSATGSRWVIPTQYSNPEIRKWSMSILYRIESHELDILYCVSLYNYIIFISEIVV